ncbi:MAG: AMP-binding protein [Solirubrobacterales bacterium]|nr:AMP-binding protein [Solirubrobacterales bacterium]MBV9534392.1 AMP-binding protein [Solirubrobacterales bacterium]
MNFARDVVDAAPRERRALVELSRGGSRRVWTFGEVSEHSARLAATLEAHGVCRGETVMTIVGNRPEWVLAMVACFRVGAVVLPCNEQLRAKDLRLRIEQARPKLIIADVRNLAELSQARPGCEVLTVPDKRLYQDLMRGSPVELSPTDPCLITFTSGTTGEPRGVVHAQRYLLGQRLQAEHWLDAREGDLVWCTAASGWSKSARNAFIAPWLRGATALLHDARFDPAERLEVLRRERVNVLCMAPTEYRAIAKRVQIQPLPQLRALVAAGEPLNPEVIRAFREVAGVEIRDGYGQTETGQLTGNLVGEPARPGSMGRPLPGVALWIEESELVLDPATDPTFFLAYADGEPAPLDKPWRTGDRVRQDENGYLYFEGRTDDVIISAGYRIGPFEVESALVSHPAVAEAAVVSAPDDERGAVVRAVVVLRDEFVPSEALVSELQEHVQGETAPYKYPRIVDFATELPKTSSGKIKRAVLREGARTRVASEAPP